MERFFRTTALCRKQACLIFFLSQFSLYAICNAKMTATSYHEEMNKVICEAISDQAFPGAAFAVIENGAVVDVQTFGFLDYSSSIPVTIDTMYDLASLTKVFATMLLAMHFYEHQQLDLHANISIYLPEFSADQKGTITISQLLSHTSGLPPDCPRTFMMHPPSQELQNEIWQWIVEEPLDHPPGEKSQYSDLDFMILGKILEKIGGDRLDQLALKHLYQPLSLKNTQFCPSDGALTAPTECDWLFQNGAPISGRVHDEKAFIFNGVLGSAGLFSSIEEVAQLSLLLMHPTFFTQKTRDTFLATEGEISSYHLGVQKDGNHRIRHHGFTGTSMWIDLDNRSGLILLTNRVHPSRDNRKIDGVREKMKRNFEEAYCTNA